MIDVQISLIAGDGRRRFELDVDLQSDAPVTALYGPSGGGKSLTLQTMAGLIRPRTGHVRIGGRTLFDAAAGIDLPAAQRRLGFLFQNYALFPHLSVRENVAFGLTHWGRRLKARDAQQVQALLESFGLAALAGSRPERLSGGQQQRVALARALACAPVALLLDEPFAALNPQLRQSLRDELARLRQAWNIPVVMITHDIEDVLALADRAFVLEEGRVVRSIDVPRAELVESAPRREALQQALLPGAVLRARHPHEARLQQLLEPRSPGAHD